MITAKEAAKLTLYTESQEEKLENRCDIAITNAIKNKCFWAEAYIGDMYEVVVDHIKCMLIDLGYSVSTRFHDSERYLYIKWGHLKSEVTYETK